MHYYKRIIMCKMQMLVKLLLYMSHQLKKLQGDRIRRNWYKQFSLVMAAVFANLNFDNNMNTFRSQLKSALLYFL